MAGADLQHLQHAPWAQVPREAYTTAVRFCIAHFVAYAELRIDETGATEQFQQLVPECITAQATSVEVSGSFPAGLDGPASTSSPEIAVG